MTCGVCGSATSGHLCRAHLGQVVEALRDFAVGPADGRGLPTAGLLDDLDAAIGRRLRHPVRTPRITRSTARSTVPIDPHSVDIATEVTRLLVDWHGRLIGPVGDRRDPVMLASALADAGPSISRHPDASALHEQIMSTRRRVMDVLDRQQDRVLLGVCGAQPDTGPCTGHVSARAGSDSARCSTCGIRYPIQDRRNVVNESLEARLVTVDEARALAAHVAGKRIARGTADSWVSRKQLRPVCDEDGQPLVRDGRKLYRWGDFRVLVK